MIGDYSEVFVTTNDLLTSAWDLKQCTYQYLLKKLVWFVVFLLLVMRNNSSFVLSKLEVQNTHLYQGGYRRICI